MPRNNSLPHSPCNPSREPTSPSATARTPSNSSARQYREAESHR